MHTNTFDYRSNYILRIDPTSPPPNQTSVTTPPDAGALYAGDLTATSHVIEDIWTQVSPDRDTLIAMSAVLDWFTQLASSRGHSTWEAIPVALLGEFIHQINPEVSDDVRRLRKNTLHAAYLALTDARLFHRPSPATGIDPVPGNVRADERGMRMGNPKAPHEKVRRPYAQRVHVRPATHDEMLLLRIACRLAPTNRTRHLPAAAIAICSASATTSEAAQVRWEHMADQHITLSGREAEVERDETAIHPRTTTLDAWSSEALADWRQERSGARPVHGDDPVLYSGNRPLNSISAQASVHQQVEKALDVADLRREPGLTPGSLRLWAAARHVTDFPELTAGAGIAGVEPFTLHRQITQQGERGLRLNS